MASELINNAQVTPQRMHALVKLVRELKKTERGELLELLQPQALTSNQDAAKSTLREAIELELVTNVGDAGITLHESLDASMISEWRYFRRVVQQRLSSVTEPNQSNFLLNVVAAWMAVQPLDILDENAERLSQRLNREIFPESRGVDTGRGFNDTKFNGWRRWASVIGWGWETHRSSRLSENRFMPDATDRLLSVLDAVLPNSELYRMDEFISALGQFCPELDGGILFMQCWANSRAGTYPGNRLSWMLSVALRNLATSGVIEIVRRADSGQLWSFYDADGSLWNEITHVRRNSVE